jgi:hypothetical protein
VPLRLVWFVYFVVEYDPEPLGLYKLFTQQLPAVANLQVNPVLPLLVSEYAIVEYAVAIYPAVFLTTIKSGAIFATLLWNAFGVIPSIDALY